MQNTKGLTTRESEEQIKTYGPNVIPEKKQDSLFELFFEQFKSPLVYTLIFVAAVTLFLKEYTDTIVITAVLTVNAIVGTVQEYRSNNTAKALRKLSRSKNNVLRDGEIKHVFTEDVTVDDVVFLESGDIVPADGMLLESHTLKINESQINGESLPMTKDTGEANQVYKSTVVVSGNGLMLVKNVGASTMIGKLATDIEKNVNNKTPLEKEIAKLSLYILYTITTILVAVFVVGLFRGFELLEIFKTSVSLGVSAIPEGLPIVLTIALSIGALRISKAKALLKNLPSGATLASVSYICTDKTGTLTHGDIEVKEIISIHEDGLVIEKFNELIYHALDIRDINGQKIGDILDLKVDAYVKGQFSYEEVKESPFTSENKYNAKEYKVEESYLQVYKGAPELFLQDSTLIDSYVREGYRVLFVGYKKSAGETEFGTEDITPLALIVFEDKIRDGIRKSIADCKATGIKVLMITGDNVDTARHVAREVGILDHESDLCILGKDVDAYSDAELSRDIAHIKVIARASPMHKERIIRILQAKKEVVAMTGDGVNDGPALAMADIGIAMGRTGTEVAKESSDLILVDDNFSNIVLAIFEARTIIENIKKAMIYIISTSIGELIIVSWSVFAGMPLPLIPVQILWLNLITDGFLDIALAAEKAEDNYKLQKYRRYQGFILGRYDITRILLMALTMGLVCITVFYRMVDVYPLLFVQTTMLCLMSMFEWLNALNARRQYAPLFTFNIFSNMYMNIALVAEIALLAFGIFSETGNRFLKTVPLHADMIGELVLAAVSILIVDTVFKLLHRRKVGN